MKKATGLHIIVIILSVTLFAASMSFGAAKPIKPFTIYKTVQTGTSNDLRRVIVNSGTSMLYAVGFFGKKFIAFDTKNGRLKAQISTTANPQDLSINIISNLVYIVSDIDQGNGLSRLSIYSAQQNKIIKEMDLSHRGNSVIFNPIDNLLYVGAGNEWKIYLYDSLTLNMVDEIILPYQASSNMSIDNIRIEPFYNKIIASGGFYDAYIFMVDPITKICDSFINAWRWSDDLVIDTIRHLVYSSHNNMNPYPSEIVVNVENNNLNILRQSEVLPIQYPRGIEVDELDGGLYVTGEAIENYISIPYIIYMPQGSSAPTNILNNGLIGIPYDIAIDKKSGILYAVDVGGNIYYIKPVTSR